MLSEMGINVVETEDADSDEEGEKATDEHDDDDDDDTGREVVEAKSQVACHRREERAVRAHRRSGAHVSARDGLGRAAVARRRNRHRQAHRGRPRGHDLRPVRKPADLPGRHHLARRIERRQSLPARHHRSGSDLRRPRRQQMQNAAVGPDGKPVQWRRHARCPARRICRSCSRPRRRPRRPPPRRSRPATTTKTKKGPAESRRRKRLRRRRHGRLAVAGRDRSRAEAESRRDLRQHRRLLQAPAPSAGAGHRVPAARTPRCRRRRSANTRSSRTRSSPR